MNVVSHKKIREFAAEHAGTRESLDAWYLKASEIRPANFVELRKTFPAADLVGNCVVFNVGGNSLRVIARIYFESNLCLLKEVLTHAEYSKNKWSCE